MAMVWMERHICFDYRRVQTQFRRWSSRLINLGVSEQTVTQWSNNWLQIFSTSAAITTQQLLAVPLNGRSIAADKLLCTTLNFDEFSVEFMFNIHRIQVYLTQTQKQVDTMPIYLLSQRVNKVPISEIQSEIFGSGPIVIIDWGVSELQFLMISGFQMMEDYLNKAAFQEVPLYKLSFDEVIASGALQTAYEQCVYLFLSQIARWQYHNDVTEVEQVLHEVESQNILERLQKQKAAFEAK